jgi:hypothetical protein
MLSERFKTIFVHIPKTAGQSIEHVFLAKHGLGWDTRAPLLLRANHDPARGPKRLAHLYAREYVELGYVDGRAFDSFFRFSVVRNPYARVISQYRFKMQERRGEPLTLKEYIDQRVLPDSSDWEFHNMVPQATFVLDRGGKVIVDEILRFEDLPGAFAPVAQRIFGEAVKLPHVNRSTGPDVADEFDAGLKRLVYRRYEKDFDLFGYPSGL